MSGVFYSWNEDRLIPKDVCFECGSSKGIHYHHVVPEVLGGKQTLPLCEECHGKVHNRRFTNHTELQRIGIERAKLEGKFQGRKKDSFEPVEKYLGKVKTKEILNLYMNGVAIREIQRSLNCSPNLIYKAVRVYNEYHGVNIKDMVKKNPDIKVSSLIGNNSKFNIPDWFND